MAGPPSSFDEAEVKTLLKRADTGGKPMSFAYGHAAGSDKIGLMLDMRKPGSALSKTLKASSKDIQRVCFGTFTVVNGDMRLKPERPIKGMIKLLVKRFRDEGLRKYRPVLVDANDQEIDEDQISEEGVQPDEDAQQDAPDQPNIDLEALKKQLVLAKKRVDDVGADRAGDLPQLMVRALTLFKKGDAQGAAATLGEIARGLKALKQEPAQPAGEDAKAEPQSPEAALLAQLRDLLRKAVPRVQAISPKERQAQVVPHAQTVQRLIGEGDAKGAAEAYKLLVAKIKEAEAGGAAPASEGARPLDIWNAAKEEADKGITALQSALRAEGHPATDRIAEFGLAGLSNGKVHTTMMAALLDHSKAPQSESTRAALARAAKDYRAFLASDIVAHCDNNPFGVQLGLAKTLGKALDRIDRVLGG